MAFTKDPDEVLDYAVDWTLWLDGDAIVTSTWIPDSENITVENETNTDTHAVIWLSGGTVGENYRFVNRITTVLGRTSDNTVIVRVR